ncbi:MAG TPA: hypothetical protein VNK82_09755 [Terriglobales bacterium]|nr:hypothetical protein [Terriglobales bacterium]
MNKNPQDVSVIVYPDQPKAGWVPPRPKPSLIRPVSGMLAMAGATASSTGFSSSVATGSIPVIDLDSARRIYRSIKGFRILFALVTVTVPVSFFLFVALGAGWLRAEFFEGTLILAYATAIVRPVAELAEQLFPFRTVINAFNWWIFAVGLAALALRRTLLDHLERAELWAKTRAFTAEWTARKAQAKRAQFR